MRLEKWEEWGIEADTALIKSLEGQESLQEKLPELESRLRMNNICIFSVQRKRRQLSYQVCA